MNKFKNKLLVGLLALALLSPLGIILPRIFHSKGAWGELSIKEVQKDLGYLPNGTKSNVSIWKAPLSDYGNDNKTNSILTGSLFYIVSGFAGMGLIAVLTWWLFKIYLKHE